MLRDFLQCTSTVQRLQMVNNSSAADWANSELDSVLDMLNATAGSKNTDAETKLQIIEGLLNVQLNQSADASYVENLAKRITELSIETAAECKDTLADETTNPLTQIGQAALFARQNIA